MASCARCGGQTLGTQRRTGAMNGRDEAFCPYMQFRATGPRPEAADKPRGTEEGREDSSWGGQGCFAEESMPALSPEGGAGG